MISRGSGKASATQKTSFQPPYPYITYRAGKNIYDQHLRRKATDRNSEQEKQKKTDWRNERWKAR